MSTWSGIRNKLENDYLCPALRGHIQYFATSYTLFNAHLKKFDRTVRVPLPIVLQQTVYFRKNLRNTSGHNCKKHRMQDWH